MSLFADAVNTTGQALPRGERYDVVVVGASLTGLVATLLLTQSGRRVALVEAGVISPARPGAGRDANEETALAAALVAAGAALHTRTFVQAVTSASPCRIDTEHGPLFADQVILATGARDADSVYRPGPTPSRWRPASYLLPAARSTARNTDAGSRRISEATASIGPAPTVGKAPRSLGRIRFVTSCHGRGRTRAAPAALEVVADILQLARVDRPGWKVTLQKAQAEQKAQVVTAARKPDAPPATSSVA
ncbi:glycine/D-amino acid oxidase-like deaminating enzyme [Microbacterium sp. AK009]|uniref:FAD-dependent oxidoreductase n=1 Tax=Microbacterium sp. AK009 TaxID=2723068 RepID=UPI0015C6ECEE|nr:FAD-dependent oxidoreductase [Microbacterium sp. AK009]NYF15710.1 glycine/D-amino acid oxidase-like deaminating enzyme [Microbacterium sp. AK009]